MRWQEINYWNQNSYGSAFRVKKWTIQSTIIALGVIVPVILPIPLMAFISRFVKKDLIVRYEK